MNIKRRLIHALPEGAKRALAVPYDTFQVRRANKRFARKEMVEREPSEDAPENIVVVVVDALRGDVIDERLTPFLAGLNGITDAVAPAPWTFPSVSSMLTGVYPHEHGAMRQDDEYDDSEGLSLPPQMDEDRETITEVLAGAGYRTRGVFGHDTPFIALSGRFHDHKLYHEINSNDEDVLESYIGMVENSERKEFGYIHLAGPHIPVDPPEEYWEKHGVKKIDGIKNWRYQNDVECNEDCERYRRNRRDLYRASVDYTDDAIREFYEKLSEMPGDTLLYVTSDHGESMWENVELDITSFGGTGCVGHGGTPYEAVSRVPLLTDSDATGFSDGYSSLIDIVPSILEKVGLTQAMETTGEPLCTLAERDVIVEGSMSGCEKKAVYDGQYKLIVSKGDGIRIVFDIPGEDTVEVSDERERNMADALPRWPDGSEGGKEVSAVVEGRLADLGYK